MIDQHKEEWILKAQKQLNFTEEHAKREWEYIKEIVENSDFLKSQTDSKETVIYGIKMDGENDNNLITPNGVVELKRYAELDGGELGKMVLSMIELYYHMFGSVDKEDPFYNALLMSMKQSLEWFQTSNEIQLGWKSLRGFHND